MKSRLLVAFLIAGSCTGCALAGERAANNNGSTSGDPDVDNCPGTETCSPDTPNGLYFWGPGTFDSLIGGSVLRLAAGGTQTITVALPPEGGANFDDPFDAAGTGPIGIESVAPPDVVVRADSEGEGYLRILEPGTGDLYDRVLLRSEEVAKVNMVPAYKYWADPDVVPDGWALFAGAPIWVGAQLRSGEDDMLVDESMELFVEGAAAPSDPPDGVAEQWDVVHLVPEDSGEITVTAKLASGAFSHTYPIVSSVTGIERVASWFVSDTDPVPKTSPEGAVYLCFRAVSGAHAVAGVSWKMTGGAGVQISQDFDSCFSVSAGEVGKYSVTVSAGSASLTVEFEVTLYAAGAPSKSKSPWQSFERAPTAGERVSLEESK